MFQYESDRAPDGHKRFPVMHPVNYDSAKDYRSWEPGCIESISMESSLDDPWAELAVVKPLGACYSINSDRVLDVSRIARFQATRPTP